MRIACLNSIHQTKRFYLELGVTSEPCAVLFVALKNVSFRKDKRLSSTSKYTASEISPLMRRKK